MCNVSKSRKMQDNWYENRMKEGCKEKQDRWEAAGKQERLWAK